MTVYENLKFNDKLTEEQVAMLKLEASPARWWRLQNKQTNLADIYKQTSLEYYF